MQDAIALRLPFWQDPQSSLALALASTSNTCDVFFALWDDTSAEPLKQLGKITFSDCWATSTVSTDLLPYSVAPHTFVSFLLEVPNSCWLANPSCGVVRA